MIQTIRPTPAMMMASLRRRTGQSIMVKVGPLDQSQRSLGDTVPVPVTACSICSTAALVLFVVGGIAQR